MIAKVIRHIQIQIGCLQLEYVFFIKIIISSTYFAGLKSFREKNSMIIGKMCLEPGSRFLRFVEVWALATNYNNTILELLLLNFGWVIRLICIDFVLSEIQPYSDWYLL